MNSSRPGHQVFLVQRSMQDPLSSTALSKACAACGEVSNAQMLIDPADSPATVTLPGLPPKNAALCRTHRSAASWSCSPNVPDPDRPGWPRKPNTPSR